MSRPYTLSDLCQIMAKLRDPETGCPWDVKQTFASIVPHTLEEAYEVADAIENQQYDELKGELGDLLFQVIFYAQLGQEQSLFSFDEIVDVLCEKLIRRHPHVFGDKTLLDEAAVKANWEAEKANERAQVAASQQQASSILDNIPQALPALNRALKLQKRCASVGFDWDSLGPVVGKIHEEIDEVMEEACQCVQDEARLEEEMGDLLFAVTNLSRHLKVNPETALRKANAKFEKRFRQVEQLTEKQGKTLQESSLAELDVLWDRVKEADEN